MKYKINEKCLKKIIAESVRKVVREESLGWGEKTVALLDDLKEKIGAEQLLDEVLGKFDERMVYHALKEISMMYNYDDEDEF